MVHKRLQVLVGKVRCETIRNAKEFQDYLSSEMIRGGLTDQSVRLIASNAAMDVFRKGIEPTKLSMVEVLTKWFQFANLDVITWERLSM